MSKRKRHLTPKKTTYTRIRNGNVEIVQGTVYTNPNKDQKQLKAKKQTISLPKGYRFTKFVSAKGKKNIKDFIRREYGADRNFSFPKRTEFFGIVGPDKKIVAAGEVWRMNWAISEIRHLVVSKKARGKGLGSKLHKYLESKVTTPVVMFTTKHPAVKKIAERNGYRLQNETRGPSGDKVAIYIKNIDNPASWNPPRNRRQDFEVSDENSSPALMFNEFTSMQYKDIEVNSPVELPEYDEPF